MINMSKYYELRNEEADRRLFNMESDIETVALALILAVVVRTRTQSLTATFLAEEIASDAGLTTDDVLCSKAIASRWLDANFYAWGGENNE